MGMTIREREERRKRGIGSFITNPAEIPADVTKDTDEPSVQLVEIDSNQENKTNNEDSTEFIEHIENKEINEKKNIEPIKKYNDSEKKYVHKSYYIRPDQFRSINIEAASTGIDKSEIVRQAIDAWFESRNNQ